MNLSAVPEHRMRYLFLRLGRGKKEIRIFQSGPRSFLSDADSSGHKPPEGVWLTGKRGFLCFAV